LSDHTTLPPLSDRLRREVDPVGTRSAETHSWNGETVRQLITECVRATRIQFRDVLGTDNDVVVDERVEYFMRGFVIGRGFDVDVTDALLVALNFEPHAV